MDGNIPGGREGEREDKDDIYSRHLHLPASLQLPLSSCCFHIRRTIK